MRVSKVGSGAYKARVEVSGVSIYSLTGTYPSRGEAREAALRVMAAGLGEMMAAHDVDGV